MRNIRPLTALLLCAVLVFVTTGFDACDKKIDKAEFISYAKDINQAFISFGPIIAQHKPHLKPKWDKGTETAGLFLAAVEASNKDTVLELIGELIPLVNQVVSEFTDKPGVLIALAAADIGLHFFVNHYTDAELASVSTAPKRGKKGSSSVSTAPISLQEFKKQKVWGCDYKPEKCKGLKKAA